MKQDLYSIFFDKTKSKTISEILTKLAYLIFVILYIIKSLFSKRQIISCNNPEEIVSKIYPKPNCTPEIVNLPINEEIDISVIMPVYNYKDIIESCIDSVLAQKTKYNFELILVDDGSTDGAALIVDNYAKLNNVKVIHKKNAGIGAARNTGLNNACGKYIMFVDCDDYVHDNFIETMLDEAYGTDKDMVVCSYTLVKKQDGRIISERNVACSSKNIMGYKDSEDFIMNYQGLPWNKVYKRSLFSNIRYMDGLWFEDTINRFLVFPKCHSSSYVDDSLYDYMWYEKNFSHVQGQHSPKSMDRYWIVEIMVEECKRIGGYSSTIIYKNILRHIGNFLYNDIKKFDQKVINATFIMACELLNQYKPKENYHLTYMEKQLEKALLTKNISKWKLVCTTL